MGFDIEQWRCKIGTFDFAKRNLKHINMETGRRDLNRLFIPALTLLLLVSCFGPTELDG